MSVWIDVTTSVSCPPPFVGITRVESSLARKLCEADGSVRACFYEASLDRFSELPVAELMRVMQIHRSAAASRAPIELRVDRHDRSAGGGLDVFDRGDVVISCGLNWRREFGNMGRLYAFRKSIGLKLVTMCYDIMPIKFTHWVPGMETVFTPYMLEMVRNADHVLCNSRCARRDLLEWIDSIGERIPDTSIVPLAAEIRAVPGESVGTEVAKILARPFLLFVSTIESRKNHQVLCRAYGQLVDWGVTELPRLVFAGGVGQGGREVVDEIVADRRLRDRVTVVSGTSDTELAALYGACLYTLFPSLYEGWGLPVSESLSCGKFCISSNQGSLPEAGEEFVEYLDPWNVRDWAHTIYRYLTVPGAVARREHEIRQHYRPRQWSDAAAHVLAVAGGLSRNT